MISLQTSFAKGKVLEKSGPDAGWRKRAKILVTVLMTPRLFIKTVFAAVCLMIILEL